MNWKWISMVMTLLLTGVVRAQDQGGPQAALEETVTHLLNPGERIVSLDPTRDVPLRAFLKGIEELRSVSEAERLELVTRLVDRRTRPAASHRVENREIIRRPLSAGGEMPARMALLRLALCHAGFQAEYDFVPQRASVGVVVRNYPGRGQSEFVRPRLFSTIEPFTEIRQTEGGKAFFERAGGKSVVVEGVEPPQEKGRRVESPLRSFSSFTPGMEVHVFDRDHRVVVGIIERVGSDRVSVRIPGHLTVTSVSREELKTLNEPVNLRVRGEVALEFGSGARALLEMERDPCVRAFLAEMSELKKWEYRIRPDDRRPRSFIDSDVAWHEKNKLLQNLQTSVNSWLVSSPALLESERVASKGRAPRAFLGDYLLMGEGPAELRGVLLTLGAQELGFSARFAGKGADVRIVMADGKNGVYVERVFLDGARAYNANLPEGMWKYQPDKYAGRITVDGAPLYPGLEATWRHPETNQAHYKVMEGKTGRSSMRDVTSTMRSALDHAVQRVDQTRLAEWNEGRSRSWVRRAESSLYGELAGGARFAGGVLVKEGIHAVQTGDPERMWQAARGIVTPEFGMTLATFGASSRVAERVLNTSVSQRMVSALPKLVQLPLRSGVPMAVGMLVTDRMATGEWNGGRAVSGTASLMVATSGVSYMVDGILLPALRSASPLKGGVLAAIEVGKLGLSLYVGEAVEKKWTGAVRSTLSPRQRVVPQQN